MVYKIKEQGCSIRIESIFTTDRFICDGKIIFINKIIAVCGLISTYSDCFICREKYLETSNARRLRK